MGSKGLKFFFSTLTINLTLLKSLGHNDNILMEGIVSRNFDLGPSLYFM